MSGSTTIFVASSASGSESRAPTSPSVTSQPTQASTSVFVPPSSTASSVQSSPSVRISASTPLLSSTSPSSASISSAILSSNSSSIPTSTSAPDDQGLSKGSVAGVGIGTFLAGVVIALIGVWFCVIQRRRKRNRRGQDNGTPMMQMRDVERAPDMRLDRILLEPVSSNDIKMEMKTIGSQIIQHVDNNYHLQPVDKVPADLAEVLTKNRYNMLIGFPIDQLSLLLQDGQTRRAAIRHLVSYFILSQVALTSDLDTSLLPTHIIAFLRQMPSPERTAGSREAFDQVFTKWRVLSAYLLQTVRSNRDPLLPDESNIQPAITNNVNTLRRILAPFVTPGAERRQAENLHGLMLEGAKFGLILFQQPASWVVDWEVPPTKGSHQNTNASRAKPAGITLFPGLVNTTDEEGKRYPQAKSALAPEVLYF